MAVFRPGIIDMDRRNIIRVLRHLYEGGIRGLCCPGSLSDLAPLHIRFGRQGDIHIEGGLLLILEAIGRREDKAAAVHDEVDLDRAVLHFLILGDQNGILGDRIVGIHQLDLAIGIAVNLGIRVLSIPAQESIVRPIAARNLETILGLHFSEGDSVGIVRLIQNLKTQALILRRTAFLCAGGVVVHQRHGILVVQLVIVGYQGQRRIIVGAFHCSQCILQVLFRKDDAVAKG